MRTRGIKTLAVGIGAIAAGGAWGGCTTTKPTELVPGILSQVQVPRNLQALTVEVVADGKVTFCDSYQVYDGRVELPRTLGVVSSSAPQTTVTITIRGYDQAGATASSFMNCSEDEVSTDGGSLGAPRVLRRSVQTYVPGHELFVPMPLSYSCFDMACGSQGVNATCKGAQCVDGTVDAGALVEYNPNLVYGVDEPCFHASECFTDAVPAVPVPGQSCTYRFLEPTPPRPGLNVRVFYQDLQLAPDTVAPVPASANHAVLASAGEEEILSEDATEGFIVLPNQQFQLAPGLCKLAQAATTTPPLPDGGASLPYRAITDVQVASACPSKAPLLPICASEKPDSGQSAANLPSGEFTPNGSCNVPRKLLPAPSALYLAVDDTQYMQGNTPAADAGAPDGGAASLPAFGANGQATFLALFLSNPVFSRTYLAFNFLTHNAADCASAGGLFTATTTAYQTPAVDFGLAASVAPQVQNKLLDWSPPAGDSFQSPLPLELEGAMRLDAGAYSHVVSAINSQGSSYNTQALMLFVNRAPGSALDPECSPQNAPDVTTQIVNQASAAFTQKQVQTFFVVLNDAANDAQSTVVPAYQQIAQRAAAGAVSVVDATNDSVSLGDFAKVMEPLSTCLYSLPDSPAGASAIDWTTAQVKFTNPVAAPGQGDTIVPASDLVLDSTGKRLRITGTSCANLQNLVIQVSEFSILQSGGSLQQVPSQVSWLDVPVTITPQCGGTDAGAGGG